MQKNLFLKNMGIQSNAHILIYKIEKLFLIFQSLKNQTFQLFS